MRELGLSAGVIGIVFSIGATARSLAAFTAMRLSRRFGIGPTTIVMAALFGPATLLVAFAPTGNAAIPFLIAAQLVFFYTVVVYNIIQVSYRQAICPPRLQGRMNSVMRFLVWGTIPIGTLAGGALGTWIGLRETIVVGAIGGGFAFLWIVFSPQRHLRDMPEPIEDEPRTTELGATLPGVADPLSPTDPLTCGVWPRGGLWRHSDFLKLWSAETISQFGTQITQLALPLVAILDSRREHVRSGALGTVEFLPFILFTLPAGVWVDRLPRRPILIAGDFGRAALLLRFRSLTSPTS